MSGAPGAGWPWGDNEKPRSPGARWRRSARAAISTRFPRSITATSSTTSTRWSTAATTGARSVALYLELFPDLRFSVEDQVTEGDRVASRWRLEGTHRGRSVTLRGIVISRFQDDRIIEDWAASDTMEIPRQLGLWRSLWFSRAIESCCADQLGGVKR